MRNQGKDEGDGRQKFILVSDLPSRIVSRHVQRATCYAVRVIVSLRDEETKKNFLTEKSRRLATVAELSRGACGISMRLRMFRTCGIDPEVGWNVLRRIAKGNGALASMTSIDFTSSGIERTRLILE